jgi:hypothetical protein
MKLSDLFSTFGISRICRTRMISDQFFECKVKKPNPKFCEYSMSLGGGFICKHPDRSGFTAA